MAVSPFPASAVFPPPAPQLPSSRSSQVPSPRAQPPGNELSALSWSRSSLYSQWREMGTGATVPVTVGSPRQHPEAKGFGFPPTQCLRMSGEKPFICAHEIKAGRLSPWGQIPPPSAPAQTPSKMQMLSVDPWWVQARTGREAGSAFWAFHKASNPPAQLENSPGFSSSRHTDNPISSQNPEP